MLSHLQQQQACTVAQPCRTHAWLRQAPPTSVCVLFTFVQVAGFNYQLAYSSQNPVTQLPPSEAGFYDVFGSAWEWAEDHFAALPGACISPSQQPTHTG